MPFSQDRHDEYVANLSTWKKCRDSRAGEDAVKLAGETYLPKLGGQTKKQYDAYRERSRFFSAFAKTLDGFTGLAMRKPLAVDTPDSMEDIINNIDRTGSDVTGFTKSLLNEILEVGRAGTLVDFDKVDDGATLKDTVGSRPYWVSYKTEDILDWEYEDGVLTYVVLAERIPRKQRAQYGREETQYRVLEMLDGVYHQKLYIGDVAEPVQDVEPKMNGASMLFIPFIIHQPTFEQNITQPPLIDLVNLTLSYYRLKADHMHALHFCALPTPWITGTTPDDGPKTIGPESIWYLSNPDAKVGMLEFSGAGVDAIQAELTSMEDQMAILGSRVLLPEVSENTATASKLRSLSETSDLVSIVIILSRQLTWLITVTSMWSGSGDEASVEIDKEFLPKELDPQMLTALVSAWQNSAFGRTTLTENLKEAEIIDADMSEEDILAEVEKEQEDRMVKAAEAVAKISDASPDNSDEDE